MENNVTAINFLINFKPIFETGYWMNLYWIVAVFISLIWGYNGIVYVIEESENTNEKSKNTSIYKFHHHIEAFISEFILSMLGWASLYLLLANISNASDKYDNFNIFLGTVAAICISGYGYKIVEKLGK